MWMFIIFEGIDGTGKSTIARMLAEYLDYIFVSTPGINYVPIRLAATQNIFSAFHYYVSSNYAVSYQAKKQGVVCDRYIYSTLAYNWPFSSPVPQNAFASFPCLRQPDRAFLLTASREVRLARMRNRKKEGGDFGPLDQDFVAQERALKILLQFKELCVIDTTNLNQMEVLDKIIQDLNISI